MRKHPSITFDCQPFNPLITFTRHISAPRWCCSERREIGETANVTIVRVDVHHELELNGKLGNYHGSDTIERQVTISLTDITGRFIRVFLPMLLRFLLRRKALDTLCFLQSKGSKSHITRVNFVSNSWETTVFKLYWAISIEFHESRKTERGKLIDTKGNDDVSFKSFLTHKAENLHAKDLSLNRFCTNFSPQLCV